MWVQVVPIQNKVDMILFYSFGFISGLKVPRMTSANLRSANHAPAVDLRVAVTTPINTWEITEGLRPPPHNVPSPIRLSPPQTATPH
jgi:hypothetical protein